MDKDLGRLPALLKVGDAAYADFGRYGSLDMKSGKVIKITTTGQITIDFGEVWPGNGKPRTRRFTAYGAEINGGSPWDGGRIISADRYAALAEKQRSENAKRAVFAHLRSWRLNSKAEMVAFAARLTELVGMVPDDKSAPSPNRTPLCE